MSGAALSAHSLAQETKPGGRAKLYYFFIFFFLTRLLIGVILGFEVRSNQAVDLLAENVNSRTPTSTSRRRGAARTWRPSRAPTARGPDRLWLRSRRRTRGRALPPDRIQRGWSWCNLCQHAAEPSSGRRQWTTEAEELPYYGKLNTCAPYSHFGNGGSCACLARASLARSSCQSL